MKPAELPLAASRWFFLGNIVLSAWMYGGTREWSRDAVIWLLLANTGLFLLGLLAKSRLPRIPLLAGLAVVFLLVQGWFMTWNAQRRFIEGARVFVDRIPPLPGWPGFYEAGLVVPSLLLSTGLLGAFSIACDMVQNSLWRKRLWVTLASTGLSLVVLGITQRLTNAPSIFWDLDRNVGQTFFAVFRYHANAGAFINLVLPLITALALKAWLDRGSEGKRVLWTLAALITAAAGFVNVSRAANVVCAILLLGMGIAMGLMQWKSAERKTTISLAGFAIVLTTLAGALAFSFGVEATLKRWDIGLWKNTPQEDGRYQAYEVIVKNSLPSAGILGFGPGTFETIFDIHRHKSGSSLKGRWDKAHSDALQTPMEWGWAGASAWFAIMGGAIFCGIRQSLHKEAEGRRLLSGACAFSLAGVTLHALVDFPLQIASLQLYSITIAGIAWGLKSPKRLKSSKNELAERPIPDSLVNRTPRTPNDPQ